MIKGLAFAALFLTLPPLPPAGSSLSPMRMTPAEIVAGTYDGKAAGGSAATGIAPAAGSAGAGAPAVAAAPAPAGIRTKVLFGDPARSGAYTILLFVPARTTIQPHSHRDDRIATVVFGTWHFGYGMEFDAEALKALPAGSVYSEPGGVDHFGRTGDGPAVVQITGYGPTDITDAERPDDRDGSDKD